MLLLRSGDRAMISDAAASATLIIAIVAGSIERMVAQNYSSGSVPKLLDAVHDRPVFLYGLYVEQRFAQERFRRGLQWLRGVYPVAITHQRLLR